MEAPLPLGIVGTVSVEAQEQLSFVLQNLPKNFAQRSSRPSIKGRSIYLGYMMGKLTKATETPIGEQLAQMANRMLVGIDFRWSAIVINISTQSSKHTDSKNKGCSIITTIGDYQGGEFQLYGCCTLTGIGCMPMHHG